MSQDEEPEFARSWVIAGIVTGAILAGWTLLSFALLCFGKGDGMSHFGDFFNVANSLFSSVAVIIAIQAIRMQHKDFRDNRKQAIENDRNQKSIAEIHALTAYVQGLAAALNFHANTSQRLADDVERAVNEFCNLKERSFERSSPALENAIKTTEEMIKENMVDLHEWSGREKETYKELKSVLARLQLSSYVGQQTPHPPASTPAEPPAP